MNVISPKCRVVVLLGILLSLIMVGQPIFGKDRLVEGEPVSVSDVADGKIQQKLSGTFLRIKDFQNIKVQVGNGVVELSGQASSFLVAEKAADLAARFEGVLYVIDEIQIRTAVDSRLAPAWRKVLQVMDQALELLPLVGIALLIFVVFFLIGRLVTAWEWLFQRFSNKVLLQNLIRQLIRYAIVFAGLLIALDILELTSLIGAFLGAAGLFGLALGFAFKDIVENYIAGFLLSISSPFGFMDWIEVSGHEGSVVRVTSRELVIMTLEGNHVRIPNAQVFKSVICNYTRNPLRRFDIEIGIGVGEDLSKVQRIGCEVLEAMKGVVADPDPSMRNLGFGVSAMNVCFSGWVDQTQADFIKVRSEAVRILKEALEQSDVDVPVPIQTVINVDAEKQKTKPTEKRTDGADVFKDAERADVDRDSHLNDQIERDRDSSAEVDLLTK